MMRCHLDPCLLLYVKEARGLHTGTILHVIQHKLNCGVVIWKIAWRPKDIVEDNRLPLACTKYRRGEIADSVTSTIFIKCTISMVIVGVSIHLSHCDKWILNYSTSSFIKILKMLSLYFSFILINILSFLLFNFGVFLQDISGENFKLFSNLNLRFFLGWKIFPSNFKWFQTKII